MKERQTMQKQVIYDVLCSLDHPTATEVYAAVHDSYPTVSRATVFRVLSGFAANGTALELRSSGQEMRYDYNTYTHYHARCTECGKVADVMATGIPLGGLTATAECGFEISGYSVEFFGRCKECQG
jgi:Fe2+ or Zn2+ uptake regulation protein